MYTDPTPLSLGSYKSNDAFDTYARNEYQFESKDCLLYTSPSPRDP